MSTTFPHRSAIIAILSATIATSSCGGGGSGGGGSSQASTSSNVPAAAPRVVDQSDLEIAQSIYSGTARTPVGFHTEVDATASVYVSTAHLKNDDVDATVAAPQPVFELCTNDWNTALEWSELSAHNLPTYANLVETNDDPRYFEFGRSRAGEPDLYLRSRVFKCTYVDRSTANLRASEGAAGLLNRRPLTATELQTLSEYLWSFTAYNNFGNAVLKSAASSNAGNLSHTLYIASLVRAGLSSTCDRIDILSWRHNANATTGELTLDVETVFSFGANEANGAVQLCSGSQ